MGKDLEHIQKCREQLVLMGRKLGHTNAVLAETLNVTQRCVEKIVQRRRDDVVEDDDGTVCLFISPRRAVVPTSNRTLSKRALIVSLLRSRKFSLVEIAQKVAAKVHPKDNGLPVTPTTLKEYQDSVDAALSIVQSVAREIGLDQ